MIGRRTEAVLNRSVRYAIEHEQEYFTLEHILWSLLDEAEVVETIKACGGEPSVLRNELEEHLEKDVPRSPKKSDTPAEHPVATLGIQRLIQRALFHVQSAGKDEILPMDLFVALFQAKDSHALHLLGKQGIERLDVLNFISHGTRRDESSILGGGGGLGSVAGGSDPEAEFGNRSGNGSGNQDPLTLYGQDLNARAQAGKIDPLIGRTLELERMVQVLCRRRKNNPLLVGEAGVGKTALAEGLALRIVNGEVPSLLENCSVYALDLGSLLAGAKFRGDFEQRLKRVLAALEAKIEKGIQPILFIDEIHTLIGAGAVSGGVLDAANMLKPLLTQGEIKCIGSTTYAEYRNTFEKDHALVRRFQKIDVPEPSQDESIQILNGLKLKFEAHHGVEYSQEAIRAAVELSAKHITDRFLPDKAIDVIDEVGARARLAKKNVKDSEVSPAEEKPTRIDVTAIEDVIAQMARIPARSVNTNQKSRLKHLERDLKLTIFGQDTAIDAITTAIRLARSGLRNGEKPMGSFLFCGPTGVGKTELSKQLAHCLGVPFLRFDMSEYGEKHTVSRLIGAPPGYVGFEQAGLLTDAVLKNPHSVVLLDEIEKAHPDIWNILLQVMDHGFLTDNNGRKADFRNVVLLMTSNVGSRDLERRPLGFETSDAAKGQRAQKAVEQTFSPEFRNRLDAIVYFDALDPVTIGQVVGKQILELESQLLSKGVEIELDAEVREWLAQKGYDRQMGARPMARLIQDSLKKPLANEILFGKLENGGKVKVTIKDGELKFKYSVEKAKALAPSENKPV
ncbi:ATP-dependent Clp protease ATP-binding subunit ClpA [bacterium]|nr:ATP-dependent Clp protease ATP-binding subunit ClpA [bacterium]